MRSLPETQPIPIPTAATQHQQQPLAFTTPTFHQPNQPAFAVIAQDPSALQALLSGDLGGRTFIIQPLQQPYILPQFQTAPPVAPYPPFAISQTAIPPQVYSQPLTNLQPQPEQLNTFIQQPAPVQFQPGPQPQQITQDSPPVWQFPPATLSQSVIESDQADLSTTVISAIQPTDPVAKDASVPSIMLRESTPQPIMEPLTITTDNRSLPQTAPSARSPPRSVQSIIKHTSPHLYQTHEAHKIPLREPQKLSTPAFLQPSNQPQQVEQQVRFTPTRETTPNPPRNNPLCEYVAKLKLTSTRTNRRTLAGGGMKSKSMPESDNLKVLPSATGDSSVMSVIDRARLWQQERQLDEMGRSRSGFVDQDLIACGDELVPVEERVRAFNTGQVVEENEAAKKKLNEEFEEERNRRIREQSFSTAVKPRTITKISSISPSQRLTITSPLSPQVLHGDKLTK